MASERKSEKKLTFRQKEPLTCPVCRVEFFKEELLSGRGRLNAGMLTAELHRKFIPTEQFGTVHPLIYTFTTCPDCFFSTTANDFNTNLSEEEHKALSDQSVIRRESILTAFPDVDFRRNRTLIDGAASAFATLLSYEKMPQSTSPIFKSALSSLRMAWILRDLRVETKTDGFAYLAYLCYNKATYFYNRIIESESNGKNVVEAVEHFGPDIDKNYGYDGVIYLSAYLSYKYGLPKEKELQGPVLEKVLITISKVVDMRKANKGKPGIILDRASELYHEVKKVKDQLG